MAVEDRRTGRGRRTGFLAAPAGTALLVAAGLGVLLAVTWSPRASGGGLADLRLYTTRLVMMAAFVLMALAGRGRDPRGGAWARPYLALALGFLAGRVAAGLFEPLFAAGSTEQTALQFTGAVCEGVGIAAVELGIVVQAARLDLRRAALAVSGAYLVAEAAFFVLLLLPGGAVAVLAPVGEVAALAAWWALALGPAAAPCDGPAPAALAAEEGAPAEQAPAAPRRPLSSISLGGAPLGAVVGLCVVLTLIWGVFAELSGEGTGAFFDAASEIVMVGVRALVVVLCVYGALWLSFRHLVLSCVALWTCGILLSVLLQGSVGVATTGLVVKAGLYLLQALTLLFAVRAGMREPGDALPAAGLVLCSCLCGMLSRLAVTLAGGIGAAALPACAAASLAAIVAALLALWDGQARRAGRAVAGGGGSGGAAGDMGGAGASPGTPGMGGVPGVDGALAAREADFLARFQRFCDENQLSERERDVLLEAVHGYTVDAIAENLGMSRETAKTHLRRIYARAGVGGKQDILKAFEGLGPEGQPHSDGHG